jgi:rSAM/selenodomain-associated transferase 1
LPISIAILSRAPVPGQTKTRLIPGAGRPAGAAELHRRLLHATVRTALANRYWPGDACGARQTPATQNSPPAQQLGPLTPTLSKSEGDLGQRMLVTITSPTLIIGTDCPLLSAEILEQAATALRDHDAVLIPAEDGGYVLIGLRQPNPKVFADIAWGSASVLASTRQRLQQVGYAWAELPTLWDVDEAADLARLAITHPELLSPP